MFLNFLNAWAFWIALGVGMLFAYVMAPSPKLVYKYPTPENAGKITYADKTGVCYRYKAIPVHCPEDPNEVQPIIRN